MKAIVSIIFSNLEFASFPFCLFGFGSKTGDCQRCMVQRRCEGNAILLPGFV